MRHCKQKEPHEAFLPRNAIGDGIGGTKYLYTDIISHVWSSYPSTQFFSGKKKIKRIYWKVSIEGYVR